MTTFSTVGQATAAALEATRWESRKPPSCGKSAPPEGVRYEGFAWSSSRLSELDSMVQEGCEWWVAKRD